MRLAIFIALLAALALCQTSSWRQSELIEPSALARALEGKEPPFIFAVSDQAPYRARHIPNAIYAGPGEKAEGIELLKAAASVMSKDDYVVIYCGSCPMSKCPNARPAYQALKDAGFTHVRVLDIMNNMESDWYNRGYPSERGK